MGDGARTAGLQLQPFSAQNPTRSRSPLSAWFETSLGGVSPLLVEVCKRNPQCPPGLVILSCRAAPFAAKPHIKKFCKPWPEFRVHGLHSSLPRPTHLHPSSDVLGWLLLHKLPCRLRLCGQSPSRDQPAVRQVLHRLYLLDFH